MIVANSIVLQSIYCTATKSKSLLYVGSLGVLASSWMHGAGEQQTLQVLKDSPLNETHDNELSVN